MAGPYTSNANGNWSNAGTWDGNGVPPEPIDNVVTINHDVTLDVNRSGTGNFEFDINAAKTLTIGAGVTLSLSPTSGGTLDVDGVLTVNGTLTLGVNGYLSIDAGGEVTLGANATWNVTGTTTIGGVLDIDATSLTLTGTFTGAGDITIEGTVDFTGADFSGFTGTLTFDYGAVANPTLTTNGVTLPDTVVDNNGVTTFVLQDAATFRAFTMTAGKFNPNGQDIVVNGNLTYTAGTVDITGTWRQTGAGLQWNWTTTSSQLASYTLTADSTCERQALCSAQKVIIEAGATLSATTAADILSIYKPAGDDFFGCAGTISDGTVRIYAIASRGNALSIDCGVLLDYQSGENRTWTQTAPLTCGGGLIVRDAIAGAVGIMDVHAGLIVAGGIVLGQAADVDKSGKLICNGSSIVIDSLVSGNAANLNNAIEIGTGGYIESPGNLNFNNITHNANIVAGVHIVCTGTGEINNFAPAVAVHCHGDASVDAGGNGGSATFNTHVSPSAMAWAKAIAAA